jgi:hypothetical protein
MDNFDLKKYLAEGRLFEEDFKNPILDKYLKLKKSIDYKTVFPTDLQSFVDSLDNTEREGLESDLAEGKLFEQESYKKVEDDAQDGTFYVSGYDMENERDIDDYFVDLNYGKYKSATQELLDLAMEQGHEYESVEDYYEYVEGFENDLKDYAEGEEVPDWKMNDLAMRYGTDYSQFYGEEEDEDYEEEEYEDY